MTFKWEEVPKPGQFLLAIEDKPPGYFTIVMTDRAGDQILARSKEKWTDMEDAKTAICDLADSLGPGKPNLLQ